MMLSTFDYAVLVALYMLVSLQGGQLLKNLKLNKIAGNLPMNSNSANALLLGLLFVVILYVVNVFSRQVANYDFTLPPKVRKARAARQAGFGGVATRGAEAYAEAQPTLLESIFGDEGVDQKAAKAVKTRVLEERKKARKQAAKARKAAAKARQAAAEAEKEANKAAAKAATAVREAQRVESAKAEAIGYHNFF